MRKERLQHKIELDTLKIRRVMAKHDISGDIIQGEAHEDRDQLTMQFDVAASIQEGFKKIVAFKDDLLKTLGVEQAQLVQNGNGRLKLQYATDKKATIPLLKLLSHLAASDQLDPLTAVLGWSIDQMPLRFSFEEPDNHHLAIFGGRSAGKSQLLRTAILSLGLTNKPAHAQFILAGNPYSDQQDHAGLKPLSYLPHLALPFIETTAELADCLAFLVSEIEHRRTHAISNPHIFFAVDDLTLYLHGHQAEQQQKQLQMVARLGPSCGIHLIFAAADPENPILHGIMDQFIPSRIVGRVDTPYQAEIATSALDSRAELLAGRGEFVAAVGDHLIPFRAAMADEADVKTCLTTIYSDKRPRLIAQTFLEDHGFYPAAFAQDEQVDEAEVVTYTPSRHQPAPTPLTRPESSPIDQADPVDWRTTPHHTPSLDLFAEDVDEEEPFGDVDEEDDQDEIFFEEMIEIESSPNPPLASLEEDDDNEMDEFEDIKPTDRFLKHQRHEVAFPPAIAPSRPMAHGPMSHFATVDDDDDEEEALFGEALPVVHNDQDPWLNGLLDLDDELENDDENDVEDDDLAVAKPLWPFDEKQDNEEQLALSIDSPPAVNEQPFASDDEGKEDRPIKSRLVFRPASTAGHEHQPLDQSHKLPLIDEDDRNSQDVAEKAEENEAEEEAYVELEYHPFEDGYFDEDF